MTVQADVKVCRQSVIPHDDPRAESWFPGCSSRALTEIARILRPGGRVGISDVIAVGLDPAQRAAAESAAGCSVGTLTGTEYREYLLAAGFTDATITPSRPLAEGLTSVVIRAHTPA